MQQKHTINRSMGTTEWALLISLSMLWGGTFFFTGVAVKELPVFTIVVARVVMAAAILHALMRIMRVPLPTDRRTWLAFFRMGLVNNAMPFCLIVWGQTHIASGLASILNATTPLFAVIVANWLTDDEKLTSGRLFGVVLGLAGVAMMIGTDVLHSAIPASGGEDASGGGWLVIVGELSCLGAAMCYAFSGVYGRRFRAMGISPMATATGQLTASSIILVPVMLIVDQPWTLDMPSGATVAALTANAALSTALAFLIYFRILASAGATNVLLVTFLIPVSAILLGVFVLGEVLQLKHFIGMAMIGLGLAAIDGRLPAMIRNAIAPRAAPGA